MRIIPVLFLLSLFSVINAQELISIDDAVSIALKNNFDIQVARNDADIDKINNTLGNAGMLPTFQATGSANYALNDEYQKLSSGAENKYPSLTTKEISAGAELNWTLFDGGKMFVTKNKLNEIQALGEIQFKQKVQETIYDVIAAYYEVVKQKQQLVSFHEAINYNKQRVLIAQTGFDAGTLDKTNLLQAKIDLNVTLENAINQETVIDAAKKALDKILGQNIGFVSDVSDSIPLTYFPDKEALFQKVDSANISILSSQKEIEIARLSLKENQRNYSPYINLKGGYYASQAINSEGSILKNRILGPQIGATIVVPLFNAGETKRQISVAKLNLQSAELNLQNNRLKVNTDFENIFNDFETQQRLLQIEKDNNQLAKENMKICLQRLKFGQSTSLELHQAQENYVQSSTRLLNYQYNLKMLETALKQLIADL